MISLIVNVFANVLYMYLESVGNHRAALLVVARAFVGFGAGQSLLASALCKQFMMNGLAHYYILCPFTF